jgi:hypothetical protein
MLEADERKIAEKKGMEILKKLEEEKERRMELRMGSWIYNFGLGRAKL